MAFSGKDAPGERQAGLNRLRNGDPKKPGGENSSPAGFVTGGDGSPGLVRLVVVGGSAEHEAVDGQRRRAGERVWPLGDRIVTGG